MNPIFTIGHSTRAFDEVLRMLRRNGITGLVDVRRFPASRRSPQWNQPVIADALPDGIECRWVEKLGGRRHAPATVESENGAWRVKAFRDYADYMAGDDFNADLGELLELAGHVRPAIMCSKAVPWRCHRQMIADALLVCGAEVWHNMSATATSLRGSTRTFASPTAASSIPRCRETNRVDHRDAGGRSRRRRDDPTRSRRLLRRHRHPDRSGRAAGGAGGEPARRAGGVVARRLRRSNPGQLP